MAVAPRSPTSAFSSPAPPSALVNVARVAHGHPALRCRAQYGSHMDWVEGIKKAMTQDGDDSAVAHIQMEGMDEHESAFATHKGPIDVELAQKYSMARRCVAIRKDGEKDAINSKGEAIKVDTYNFRTGKIKDLDTYHCGLAVQLYMYFHIDAFILFFALFLVSIYAWAENHSRNSLRNKCRDFVDIWVHGEDTGETAGMTLKQWIMQEDADDECGYSALGYAPGLSMDPVRRHPTPPGAHWFHHTTPARPPTPTPRPISHIAPPLTGIESDDAWVRHVRRDDEQRGLC